MEEDILNQLRIEIDNIDTQLHDLMMQRVKIAQKIGEVKGNTPLAIRTDRESQILRRLCARHEGPMNRDTMIHIWRELICECVNQQTPMSIAVYMPNQTQEATTVELCRSYFGSTTPLLMCRTIALVLKELSQGEANVGVLSLDPQNCWWYALSHDIRRSFNIFAKLPITKQPIYGEDKTVFAISKLPYMPSGEDNTLLVVETDGTISLSTLDLVMKSIGISTNAIYDTYSSDLMHKAYLFEVDGTLANDDIRLKQAIEKSEDKIILTSVIGGFAKQID